MLNVQSISKLSEIEAQQKDIDIVVDDENLFQLSIELPSATELKANHCKPIKKTSVSEISAQDPFNFRELFRKEFINLSKKYDRFKDSSSFVLKLAGTATLSGELDRAETILSDSIKINNDSKLLHKLGDTFILKGNNDKAIKVFEKTDLNEDIYSNLRIAYIFTKQNDLNSAYKYLENAQRIDPCDFRPQLFLGAINLNQGQCEKAIRNFRVAAIDKTDSSALHVNLAAAYWSLGNSNKAIKELRKAITINPLNENALIFYSDVMFQLNCNDKTISHLEFYINLNQKSKLAWERLARAYYFTSNFLKAKQALENQISISDEPYAYNNLGLVYWQLREHKVALKFLLESIQRSQSDNKKLSIPLLNMAIALNEKKHHKECYNLTKDFIKQSNDNVDDRILSKIATQYLVALEGLEEYDFAAKELSSFLTKPYKNVEGRIILLTCKIYSDVVIFNDFQEGSKHTESLLYLLKEHKKDIPEDSYRFAYNNIAFNCLLQNKLNEANYYLDKISKHINIDPYCTATFGLLNIKRGNVESGIKLYDTAISLASNRNFKDRIRQRMCLELGKYSISIGNNKDGIRYLNKAIKETNGYKYVIKEAVVLLNSLK